MGLPDSFLLSWRYRQQARREGGQGHTFTFRQSLVAAGYMSPGIEWCPGHHLLDASSTLSPLVTAPRVFRHPPPQGNIASL